MELILNNVINKLMLLSFQIFVIMMKTILNLLYTLNNDFSLRIVI